MTEITPIEQPAPQVPAKLSKLAKAVTAVTDNVTEIQALSATIDTLETKYGPKTAFAVATKEGMKEADEARKQARAARLKVQSLKKESTALLNGLKQESWAVADPFIARLDAIETNAKTQIEAQEKIEADRKQRHTDAIAAIGILAEGAAALGSEDIAQRIASAQAIVIDDSYEEFRAQAERRHADVLEILTKALADAKARELAAKQAAEAAAAREAELAALREQQERAERQKAKVATMRALPAQVAGTGAENVRAILRQHKASVPDATHYGEQLELAELVHEKVTRELEAILAGLEVQAEPAEQQTIFAEEVEEARAPITDAPSEPPAPPARRRVAASPAGRSLASPPPAPADVIRPSEPPPEPGPFDSPFTEPAWPMPSAADETPNLLKAAQDFITTVQECPGVMPEDWSGAYEALKAAVDFTTEFSE